MSKPQKIRINWLGSAGSALGAVTSAVLLSSLGAAGTLAGAALGSLIITVGGSIYTQSLEKTTARVSRGLRTPSLGSKETSAASEEPGVDEESAVDPDQGPEKSSGRKLRGLPWKRIIGLSVGLFVAAMAVILLFELSTGRPVSSFTGGSSGTDTGTTFSELRSGSGDSEDPDAEEPSAEATSTEEPAEQEPMKEEPTKEPRVDPPPADEPPADEPPADGPAESDE